METNLFRSVCIKTDVTTLKIIKRYYLAAGIGNVLHLFHIPGLKLMKRLEIFEGQKIHGLVTSENDGKLFIYGGKHIQLANCTFTDITMNIILDDTKIKCDDWILTLLPIRNNSNVALLTAHNTVQIWDIASKLLLNKYGCEEICILYSGLLVEVDSQVIVIGGTVFSQIIIWHTGDKTVHQRLVGHKGVIFSISHSKEENIIVSTSDDRTVRLWQLDNKNYNLEYWTSGKINEKFMVMGHTARVMRNMIIGKYIISIGEDSAMCIWDCDGNLINKKRIHQDSGLWSLDGDFESNTIVTGGGNGSIIVNSLIQDRNVSIDTLYFSNTSDIAKKIGYTYRGNIICLTEFGELMYYDFELNKWTMKLEAEMKYTNLSLSTCKQFIAVSNMDGYITIFAETCKFEPNLVHCISQKIASKLLSLHWLNGRYFITCENNGIINKWESRGNECMKINEYCLPMCKERWITAVKTPYIPESLIIIGDRCGSLHLFDELLVHPIHTVTKVHGRLGINSIEISENKVITTGRDSTVKYFQIIDSKLQLLHCVKTTFSWVDRYVIKDHVCGFRETHFVVWNIKENQSICEYNCGGGHRSWDIMKKKESLQFAFIKNSLVHTYNINMELASRNMFEGFHTKEVNSLRLIKKCLSNFLIISGGEDTALRIHNCRYENENFICEETFRITKHLSSIRDICIFQITEDNCIVFTAGGRAQICIWNIKENECREIYNYMVKSDLDRKGNNGWRNIKVDMDAETRFMSLSCHRASDTQIYLFAGCSDGFLRIYTLKNNELKLQSNHNFRSRCILKVSLLNIKSSVIIMTMYTDGVIAFWDFTSYINNTEGFEPFYHKRFHQSGINSFDTKYIDSGTILMATGGDDNDFQLNILEFSNDTIRIKDNWHYDKYHCSQITGIKLLNNNYALITSIDQRVTLLKWSYDGSIECRFIQQYYSIVSDIQGMETIEDGLECSINNEVTVLIYGKGVEVICIRLQP